MSGKTELSRAGTMQLTAKEGQNYLDRNLTEWKKPYLLPQDEESEEEAVPAKKPKLAKHTTMKGTAKEADALLKGSQFDEDALTRSQQKQIKALKQEKASAKKPRLSKAKTMAATAKEGKELLEGKKLGATRGVTKTKKSSLKRASTMAQAASDAKAVYGDIETTGGRKLRKKSGASPKKPALKKAGTMQNTAKEGKEFLKRGKKGNKKTAKKAGRKGKK